MLLFLILRPLLGYTVATKPLHVCDCATTTYLGAVDFSSMTDCPYAFPSKTEKLVRYEIFATKNANRHFKGFACQMIQHDLTLMESFFWATDTFQKDVPIEVSATMCWTL
jgi:hypothetical protein